MGSVRGQTPAVKVVVYKLDLNRIWQCSAIRDDGRGGWRPHIRFGVHSRNRWLTKKRNLRRPQSPLAPHRFP